MALPTAYLTSIRNLDGILSAIQTAQAPTRFTVAFLEGLGYKSSSDRLVINVLKGLGFLTADGVPTDRYYRYLDQTEAARVLGEALMDAYADLYQFNRNAQDMTKTEVKNKFKTLTQGKTSDDVVGKMATTFLELAKRAAFEDPPQPTAADSGALRDSSREPPFGAPPQDTLPVTGANGLGGLYYNIQIHLPESRDPAVYDAIFRSLREHLVG